MCLVGDDNPTGYGAGVVREDRRQIPLGEPARSAATASADATVSAPTNAASSTAAAIFARIRTGPAAEAAISQVCAPGPRSRNRASAAEWALGWGGRAAPPGS